jgi:hypothetical protein
VGVLVFVCYDVMAPWCFLPAASRWRAGATKAGLSPAVKPGLIGVDAAEHLVPSWYVHHDVLSCRGWDLAEEEVDFSRRSLFVVVSFVAVDATLLGQFGWPSPMATYFALAGEAR